MKGSFTNDLKWNRLLIILVAWLRNILAFYTVFSAMQTLELEHISTRLLFYQSWNIVARSGTLSPCSQENWKHFTLCSNNWPGSENKFYTEL